MTLQRTSAVLAVSALALVAVGGAQAQNADWTYHGGGGVDRYSPLTQITPANVANLKEAWRFPMATGGLESQPTVIGRTVYAPTTDRKLVALDAVTGQLKWTFAPEVAATQPIRGLAVWRDGGKLRLILGRDNFVYMIDAETGALVTTFGDGGTIDTRANLRGKAEDNAIYITSPVSVYQNLLIVNGRLAENTPASPGDVRAFDARTGKLVWTFHTIPHPGERYADSWPKDAHLTQGGANAWNGSSVDTARGIVFVNTGSPADDFVGIHRPGDNRGANSTIALDAKTGKRIWDFQQVHHDLWDSDSTSPPLLTTITQQGRKIDVAVAWNKAAYIYVFNRLTGKPIFPIVETPVPPSNVPGEVASKTQPIPSRPRPLTRKTITVNDLTTASPALNAEARAAYATFYGEGKPFTPLALNQDTLVIPGFAGAWGGMAADRKGVIYATGADGAGLSKIVDNTKQRELIGEPGAPRPFGGAQNGFQRLEYGFTGYGQFRLKGGQSGIKESIPTLNAIDINTGEYLWTVPLPGRAGGSGPLVTGSGLLFIAAGNKLKAFDTKDGKFLAEQQLPGAAGNGAGSYMIDGKQNVVLASGGGGGGGGAPPAPGASAPPTPAYVAYALP